MVLSAMFIIVTPGAINNPSVKNNNNAITLTLYFGG